jgi:hypothetical protein
MFAAPLQGFLNFLTYTRQRILRCTKRHNMCSCSLRAHGCRSSAATSVTATGVTTTSVDREHELNESQSMANTVPASETVLCTVHAKMQMIES